MNIFFGDRKIPVKPLHVRLSTMFINRILKKIDSYQNPALYWTFVICMHDISGSMIDDLDPKAFQMNMEALNKSHK